MKRFYLRSFDHSVCEKDHLQDVEIITQVTEGVLRLAILVLVLAPTYKDEKNPGKFLHKV